MNSSVYIWPVQLTIDELRAFSKEHGLDIAGLSALYSECLETIKVEKARGVAEEDKSPSRWKLTLDTDGVAVDEAARFTFGIATCVSHHSFKTILSLSQPVVKS